MDSPQALCHRLELKLEEELKLSWWSVRLNILCVVESTSSLLFFICGWIVVSWDRLSCVADVSFQSLTF